MKRLTLVACFAAVCVLCLSLCACIGISPAHADSLHLQAGETAGYKIVYKLSGDTNPTKQITEIKAGKTLDVSKLKKPKRTGYTFVGWYKNSSKTKKAKVVKGVANKTKRTLYAKWQINTYPINYKLNGGSFDDPPVDSYTVKKKVTLPQPKRPGYTFMGWYLDAGLSKPIDSIEKGSTGKLTLYARWYECVLVAHRGYSGDTPDNSPEAIRPAREKGFKYAELDVRFTSDGVPVMYHDAAIKAFALGKDDEALAVKIPISSLTYKQLQAIKFMSGQSGENEDNVFTFYDCLTLCREIEISPIIHLKSKTNDQIDQLMSMVADFGLSDDVRWFTESKTAINHVLANKPDAKILYGSFDITESRIKYAKKLADSGVDILIGIKRLLYCDEQVALCKAARVPLCFTVLPDETTMYDYDPYISMYLIDNITTVPLATDIVFP